MVWRCKYDRQKIIHMDSGMQVMGDIQSLGWVVVKWYILVNEDSLHYMMDMKKLEIDLDTKQRSWSAIQGKSLFQLPDVVPMDMTRKLLCRDKRGNRFMKYMGNVDDCEEDFPMFHKQFQPRFW